jgi:hypothetical protein
MNDKSIAEPNATKSNGGLAAPIRSHRRGCDNRPPRLALGAIDG